MTRLIRSRKRAASVLLALGLLVLPLLIVHATEVAAVYFDRFENEGSGWDVEEGDTGSIYYKNGYYVVRITRAQYLWWSWAPYSNVPDNFIADMNGFSSYNKGYCQYGIIWGLDSQNFLIFWITDAGWYRVASMLDGTWRDSPVNWTQSTAINTGASGRNRLRVTVDGDSAELAINGRTVADFELGIAPDSGAFASNAGTAALGLFDTWKIGLVAGAFDRTPVEIKFKEFALYALPDPETSDVPTIDLP
ncbi:hypothetical protein KJ567_06530 [Candidatus Bipolaricaulota bacterium]|nr:hypothetical protein [Candidatus Bipolaricaulota bacterium]